MMWEDEICQVLHAYDQLLDLCVSFGGHPRANVALNEIHLD